MIRIVAAAAVFGLVAFALHRVFVGDPVRSTLDRVRPRRRAAQPASAPALRQERVRRAEEGSGWAAGLARQLAQADLHLTVGEALTGTALLAAVIAAALWPLISALSVPVAAGGTILLLRSVLGSLHKARLGRMALALPDYLQAVANGLRSGHALTTSLEAAAGTIGEGPLREEVLRTVSETKIGISLEAALTDLSQRTGLLELDLAVTAILVQRQVGGNLAEVLDRIQQTLRDRVRLTGEVKALTAQGRLSGLVVGLLPVGLGVLVSAINPTFMAPLFDTATGHLLLGIALALEVGGMLAISRIVKVDF